MSFHNTWRIILDRLWLFLTLSDCPWPFTAGHGCEGLGQIHYNGWLGRLQMSRQVSATTQVSADLEKWPPASGVFS